MAYIAHLKSFFEINNLQDENFALKDVPYCIIYFTENSKLPKCPKRRKWLVKFYIHSRKYYAVAKID